MKLERSAGLDYLVVGEEQCVFCALLTPGSVDGSCCRIDNVDIENLRGRHLEFDPGCATCTSMTMRTRQHRRQDVRETAGAVGEVCADLTGRLPMAYNVSEYLWVALRRETRFGFIKAVANKRSETIKDAMIDCSCCCVVFGSSTAVDDWLREHAVLHTTTAAYDPNANCLVEESVGAEPWYSMSLAPSKCACVCGLMQRNTQTKSTTTTNDQCLDRAT